MDRTSNRSCRSGALRRLAAFAVLPRLLLTLWTDNVDANLKGLSSFVRSPVPSFVLSASPYPLRRRCCSRSSVARYAKRYTRRSVQSAGIARRFCCRFSRRWIAWLFFGHGMFGGLNSTAASFRFDFQLALVCSVPADLDVVERPQPARVYRPVAAAARRSVSAVASRTAAERVDLGERRRTFYRKRCR